jgi:maleamate amidohydrolase
LYRPGGLDGGAFYSKVPALSCFDQGRETQELCDGFDKRDMELMITKQYPSAFFGTSLSASLAFLKVDTLVIAGLTTSGCVRATCIDSISSGFITVIAADACGDRAFEPHQANLFDMSAKYADLMNNHEVLDYFKSSKVT